MTFSAINYYPQVRFANGQKWLFNPILKKRFAILPEERVRLQYLDFLLHRAGWNRNRVGFEIPVEFQSGENKLRADLVLYDEKMLPYALGECKAPSVKLNEKTAVQAARYNKEVKAPWLFVINGQSEFWFKKNGNEMEPANPPLQIPDSASGVNRTAEYWVDRGFLSPGTDDPVQENLLLLLNRYWADNSHVKYLQIDPPFLSFNAGHFYSFHQINEKTTLAFTILDNGIGLTRLLFTANRDRKNSGIALINPETNETELFLQSGKKTVNSAETCGIDFSNFTGSDMENMPQLAMNFFD